MEPKHRSVDPDWISILTWADHTPDPNVVLQVLRRNVPADIMYTYAAQTATIWGAFSGSGNWSHFQATYGPTWSNAKGATLGFTTWT